MKELSLKRIYLTLCRNYPNEKHNERAFVDSILEELSEDPRRTASLKEMINKDRVDYKIPEGCPLNDFYYGSQKYMKNLSKKKYMKNLSKNYDISFEEFEGLFN